MNALYSRTSLFDQNGNIVSADGAILLKKKTYLNNYIK